MWFFFACIVSQTWYVFCTEMCISSRGWCTDIYVWHKISYLPPTLRLTPQTKGQFMPLWPTTVWQLWARVRLCVCVYTCVLSFDLQRRSGTISLKSSEFFNRAVLLTFSACVQEHVSVIYSACYFWILRVFGLCVHVLVIVCIHRFRCAVVVPWKQLIKNTSVWLS